MPDQKKLRYVTPSLFRFSSRDKVPARARSEIAEQLRIRGQQLLVIDDQHRYISVSEAFARQLGYQSNELIGRTVEELTAPNTANVDFTFRVLKTLGEMDGLWMLVHRLGMRVLVRFRASYSHGKVTAECETVMVGG